MIYPHAKVFVDTDNKYHFVTVTHKSKSGHKIYDNMGSGLIDFITLDLSEYENTLKKADSSKLAYDDMRNLIFDIAETLRYKHEYIWFFLVGALNNIFAEECNPKTQLSRCFDVLYSIIELHQIFNFGVLLCLDVDNHPEFTTAEKYFSFTKIYEKYSDFLLKTSFTIAPSYKGVLDFAIVEGINKKAMTETREVLKAVQRDNKGVNLVQFTLIETLEEMLYFEFIELLKQGTNVKKCRLCGRYFMLANQHETYFCNRIYSGKRTCRQVGTKRDYNEKVANDAVLQEYQRIYKRYFSRGEMPFEKNRDSRFCGMSFREWSALARGFRRRYVAGEISGEDLLKGIRE